MYEIVMTNDELYHHGIIGQKWGIRRYQNPDGTLTEAGKQHLSGVERHRYNQLSRQIKRHNDIKVDRMRERSDHRVAYNKRMDAKEAKLEAKQAKLQAKLDKQKEKREKHLENYDKQTINARKAEQKYLDVLADYRDRKLIAIDHPEFKKSFDNYMAKNEYWNQTMTNVAATMNYMNLGIIADGSRVTKRGYQSSFERNDHLYDEEGRKAKEEKWNKKHEQ